jgi:Na+/proline symporter/archaellum biogenesis ATPase FlaH
MGALGLIGPQLALLVLVLYLLLLFGIARYAQGQRLRGRSIVSNPYVYALSLCVYVSAWTFYGSIGRAASSGLEFLTIYLGPSLAMLLGWVLIRKMIRISKEFRLTSISDFISFRYGRSYAVGAIVAVAALMMVTPYVALQLLAISTSLQVFGVRPSIMGVELERRLIVALILGVFAVIFGARELDPMERHEGLIAVVAFESLVKLVSFLAAGIYLTYFIFGGYGEIFQGLSQMIAANPDYSRLLEINYPLWFTLTLISFFAILFLPRQFHVMIVENSDESHLKKAMWLFPLYLLLINLFVPAIAYGGLILKTPGLKDAFIIAIPYSNGHDLLALFIFIGGASAATAMILVESVAVGTMMLNDLELPYLLRRIGGGRNLPNLLLNMRRLNILLVVALGYLYSRLVAYQSLVSIGLVSFLAASQLAPAALGGMYWKKGSREGAIAGLVSGVLIWIYTALVPTLIEAGWISSGLITDGPFGIALLKPTALFGINLDMWINSAFWSLSINCAFYVFVSLISRPSTEEAEIATSVVDVYEAKVEPMAAMRGAIRVGTVDELELTLARYIGEEKARELIDQELAYHNATRSNIDARQLLELWLEIQRTLTGSVGSSATRMIVEEQVTVKPVVEAEETTRPRYTLEQGKIYIVPTKAFDLFTDQITHGVEGLCITHRDPEEIRRRWGFRETPIIKLSQEKGNDRYISPTNLPLLFMTIRSFVESSKNSIVLIDSIEHLLAENAGRVPERELLDFVHQIELLGRKTRVVLSERQEFVHANLKRDINEVKDLVFTLGPLSAYLFRVFSLAMLVGCSEAVRSQAADEANDLIESGRFFETVRGEKAPNDGSAGSCEPDMRNAYRAGSLRTPPDLVLSRRAFFAAARRLARIISKYDPKFDFIASVADLLKGYGWCSYEMSLIPGTTYVIEEEKPARILQIFSELVTHDMDGLCISRSNPEILQERYGIPQETVIWLTQKSEPGYRTVDPTNFPRLSSMISEFLDRARYPVVLLEGLGYLITQSNYETVLRFIQSQRDEVALKDAITLVHIDPLSLDTKELHRLESEMEPLKI